MRKQLLTRIAIFALIATFFVLLAVPAYAAGIPGDADQNGHLTRGELSSYIMSYMSGNGNINLHEVQDSAYIYVYWGGTSKTVKDSTNKTFTFNRPIRKIIPLTTQSFEMMRTLNSTDRIIAVPKYIVEDSFYYPGYQNYTNVGDTFTPDVEKIVSCNPDVVIVYTSTKAAVLDDKLKGTNITVMRFDFSKLSTYVDEINRLSDLLDKKDRANEYIAFYNEKVGRIQNVVATIPQNEKPRVYLEGDFGSGKNYQACGKAHGHDEMLTLAGGVNIFGDISYYQTVSPESVIKKNPQVIMKYKYPAGDINRNVNNTTDLQVIRNEVLSRPELQKVEAVKNGKVYVYDWYSTRGGAAYYLCIEQMAKWCYPDRFKDVNPRADYAEYLQKFQGLNIDLNHTGVFFYPES
ncbi:ABC-type Fe3+-hydroxamate transport system, periplasmic component [Methanocella conradii HZ254]|uniref:ABC-type Fe3+-hydroxamate transport system, periplasmic component n=1 Tax=Methanocella conradii (strain DSM 24694 / JCM 17849 / CGMCC 1.5162 / HZ254) TaxID=1041930 RepID=H8I8X1_METCZ|nr:ABC transporter substrate-binding protein [Methanocella conradii]AFD00442.1 ABC-type Fe3+-hydroxamate transport system, periplasmic component [Methanocella conradii HZ254]